MNRRRPIVVALIVLAGTLAACGGGGGGGGGEEVDDAARAPNQDIRVAVGEDPFLRGTPPGLNLGLVVNGPNPGIYETLTRLTPAFGLTAGLAMRWESRDPSQWRFELRPNVTFHNGAPFNAPAVVDTLELIARRQNRPRGLDPGTVKAVNDLTVEVNLTTPNARLAEQLAAPNMGILAPGTQAGAGPDPNQIATGTGPFAFDSYAANNLLKVKANEKYWGGPPQLRTITFRFGPEKDASRLLATRQVELVGQIPYEDLAKVSGRTDRVVESRPSRSATLLLNSGGVDEFTTLKDDSVRKAVVHAIDNRAIAKTAWMEDGEENDAIVPNLVLADAVDRAKPVNQDLNEAKRALDQAGWSVASDGTRMKQGKPLVLSLILARPTEHQKAADLLRTQLAQAGIGLRVVDPAPDTPFTRVNNGTFDLYMATFNQDDGNPCAICRFFTIRPGGQLAFAGAAGGGAKVDELYDRIYTSPSPDTARRLAIDIMNVVMNERYTAVPLASLRNEWLMSPRVRGFEPASLTGDQRWDTVWLTV